MIKTLLTFVMSCLLISMVTLLYASPYGKRICNNSGYRCLTIKRGETWEKLWPDKDDQDVVKRLNRTNTRLHAGATIAVPDNLWNIDHMDISPFPKRIEPYGEPVIIIVMSFHAFAAYDQYGQLQHWGPVSGGKGYCPDVGRRCTTPLGTYRFYSKQGPGCFSTKYPIPYGGSPMPYCMFFRGGFALHGGELPGYHASHGCVRLFPSDARWLNLEFIELGKKGTKLVIVQNWPGR